jgi:hypothetical protein
VKDALGFGAGAGPAAPAPRLEGGWTAPQKALTAASVLRAMGLREGFGRLVLLLGHGATTANNPHASAYHCGACGGQTGGGLVPPARIPAQRSGDPRRPFGRGDRHARGHALRRGAARHHHPMPCRSTSMPRRPIAPADIAQARAWLSRAAAQARAERALRLPGATAASVADRAVNWAEPRPEWGLAGCAAFIAAPRRGHRRPGLRRAHLPA